MWTESFDRQRANNLESSDPRFCLSLALQKCSSCLRIYAFRLLLLIPAFSRFASSVGAAVLAEPLLQRGLSQGPLQVPVELADGQPLPDPMVAGRKARPRWQGKTSSWHRKTSVTFFWLLFNAGMADIGILLHTDTGSCPIHLDMGTAWRSGAYERRKMKIVSCKKWKIFWNKGI